MVRGFKDVSTPLLIFFLSFFFHTLPVVPASWLSPPQSHLFFFCFSSWWLLIRSGFILCGYPACVSHGVPGLRGHSTLPDSDRSIKYHSYYMSLPPPENAFYQTQWYWSWFDLKTNYYCLTCGKSERPSLRQPPTFILVCRLPVVLRADCIRTQVTRIWHNPLGMPALWHFTMGGGVRRSLTLDP